MDEKFKQLTQKLANHLNLETLKFMVENLEVEENTSDIINFVLSSHLSSMFTCMTNMVEENEKMADAVKKFIDELSGYISKMHPIEKMEWLT